MIKRRLVQIRNSPAYCIVSADPSGVIQGFYRNVPQFSVNWLFSLLAWSNRESLFDQASSHVSSRPICFPSSDWLRRAAPYCFISRIIMIEQRVDRDTGATHCSVQSAWEIRSADLAVCFKLPQMRLSGPFSPVCPQIVIILAVVCLNLPAPYHKYYHKYYITYRFLHRAVYDF